VVRLAGPLIAWLAWQSIRAICRLAVRRIDLQVEGLEYLPRSGSVLIAARHFHHFWDGCALLAVVPRPLRLVVTLDWLQNPIARTALAAACTAAGWPVVPRTSAGGGSVARADRAANARHDLLVATRESVGWLRQGGALLVFPEGFPNVDPHGTPKLDDCDFLPFQSGFLRFVALSERGAACRVPIVPVGLEYVRGQRWRVIVRIGPPLAFTPGGDRASQVDAVEEQVRRLSGMRIPRSGECVPPPRDPIVETPSSP
jgi:1-acyl-sn-glycerol-3-phosphate acyltransferase